MKQLFLIALMLCVAMSSASCGQLASKREPTEPALSFTKDESGNSVLEGEQGPYILANSLPVKIPYNDNTVTFSDVTFYESQVDYEYFLFALVTVNTKGLSDEELHWFLDGDMELMDRDISIFAYVDSKENGLDSKSLDFLYEYSPDGSDNHIFVYTTPLYGKYRHSFDSASVTTIVQMKQDEYYDYINSEGNTTKLNKTASASIDLACDNLQNISELSNSNYMLYASLKGHLILTGYRELLP